MIESNQNFNISPQERTESEINFSNLIEEEIRLYGVGDMRWIDLALSETSRDLLCEAKIEEINLLQIKIEPLAKEELTPKPSGSFSFGPRSMQEEQLSAIIRASLTSDNSVKKYANNKAKALVHIANPAFVEIISKYIPQWVEAQLDLKKLATYLRTPKAGEILPTPKTPTALNKLWNQLNNLKNLENIPDFLSAFVLLMPVIDKMIETWEKILKFYKESAVIKQAENQEQLAGRLLRWVAVYDLQYKQLGRLCDEIISARDEKQLPFLKECALYSDYQLVKADLTGCGIGDRSVTGEIMSYFNKFWTLEDSKSKSPSPETLCSNFVALDTKPLDSAMTFVERYSANNSEPSSPARG